MRIYKFKERKISDEQARVKILAYLGKHPDTDAHDVALALRINPARCIDLCGKLAVEGKIKFCKR